MFSQSLFSNFGLGPFPKIAGKSPADDKKAWKNYPGGKLTLKAPITTTADDKLQHLSQFSKKIRYDITWELSASRQFSLNIMPYLLFLKKQRNFKLSSAANYRWGFKTLMKAHLSGACSLASSTFVGPNICRQPSIASSLARPKASNGPLKQQSIFLLHSI